MSLEVKYKGRTFPIRFWDGHPLTSDTYAIDTETYDIQGPWDTPDLVLFQAFDGETLWLADWTNAGEFMKAVGNRRIIMHNAPFDVDVLEKACGWKCYPHVENDLLWDTGVLFRLRDLARRGQVGQWSLAFASKIMLDEEMEKGNDVRLGWTREKRCHEWEPQRLIYGAKDTLMTWYLFKELEWILGEKNALSHQIQLKGEICLNRVHKRGVGFDLEARHKLLKELDVEIDDLKGILEAFGWVPGRKGVQKVEQEILARLEEEHQLKLPRSEKTKRISTRKDDLEELMEDRFISTFVRYKEQHKFCTFIKKIESDRVHPRYTGILRTGRTSCTSPNLQQLPRRPGIRECFKIVEPGNVLVAADYSAIELATLAQVCYSRFGISQMREIINTGKDLHRWCASMVLQKPEEEVTSEDRRLAKSLNFGLSGGLGWRKLKDYAAATYGVTMTDNQAKHYREQWIQAFVEMEMWLTDPLLARIDFTECPIPGDRQQQMFTLINIGRGIYTSKQGKQYPPSYFRWAYGAMCELNPSLSGRPYDPEKDFTRTFSSPCEVPVSGFVRGRASFTQWHNCQFQSLAAAGAKLALWNVMKKGLYIWAFVHDEIIVEIPEAYAEEALADLQETMISSMREVVPDVKVATEGAILGTHWRKM